MPNERQPLINRRSFLKLSGFVGAGAGLAACAPSLSELTPVSSPIANPTERPTLAPTPSTVPTEAPTFTPMPPTKEALIGLDARAATIGGPDLEIEAVPLPSTSELGDLNAAFYIAPSENYGPVTGFHEYLPGHQVGLVTAAYPKEMTGPDGNQYVLDPTRAPDGFATYVSLMNPKQEIVYRTWYEGEGFLGTAVLLGDTKIGGIDYKDRTIVGVYHDASGEIRLEAGHIDWVSAGTKVTVDREHGMVTVGSNTFLTEGVPLTPEAVKLIKTDYVSVGSTPATFMEIHDNPNLAQFRVPTRTLGTMMVRVVNTHLQKGTVPEGPNGEIKTSYFWEAEKLIVTKKGEVRAIPLRIFSYPGSDSKEYILNMLDGALRGNSPAARYADASLNETTGTILAEMQPGQFVLLKFVASFDPRRINKSISFPWWEIGGRIQMDNAQAYRALWNNRVPDSGSVDIAYPSCVLLPRSAQ